VLAWLTCTLEDTAERHAWLAGQGWFLRAMLAKVRELKRRSRLSRNRDVEELKSLVVTRRVYADGRTPIFTNEHAMT
jgi:hypothetical protein